MIYSASEARQGKLKPLSDALSRQQEHAFEPVVDST